MREQSVILEPFELLDILQCSGKVCGNEHGYMIIKGHISNDKEEEYLRVLSDELWCTIKIKDEMGNSEILFSGIVTQGCILVENGLKTLSVTVKTGSFLMDLKKHTRSYQSDGITYEQVLDSLKDSYESFDYIMNKGEGQSIGGFLCQYQETDWKFAKRLAGGCNALVYPNYIGYGEKIYFGMPSGKGVQKIELTEYSVIQTEHEMVYRVKLRDLFNIGDNICFLNKNLVVVSRETYYLSGELYHYYDLVEQKEALRETTYNDNLIGVSLDAIVTEVAKTFVMISILEDENYRNCGNRWFSYATVYSSPDGTGWYCMPECGDRVRLYFPSNKENEAYVLNSTHLNSQRLEERVNPDFKSIMNKQGKEILLKPDSIIVTNNAGMSLELSDEEGITIISDKKIVLQSDEAIEITSVNEKIDIVAYEKISLKQGNTNMVLSDKLVMSGAKIRLD